MALLGELGPVLALALTVGVSASVTVGAHLLYRREGGSFESALRVVLLAAGVTSLLAAVVWTIAGGGPSRGVSVTPLVAVFVAFLGLTLLPLAGGRALLRRGSDADSATALRFATYGWPLAMLAVFGVYVAYWLFTRDIYHPGNGQICVVWRCTGITVASAVTVSVGAVVAVFGTGLAGLRLYASATEK
ncbi:hypothetical protein SAMN04488063_3593 [Halopelagius inordinatus]|uniref:Uncharacterized protein n=1 Tax=Halopelagius inordinatus TaxID=553467 RepID=A0A1I2WJ83_9EURY|nr:hypothetical protein [Halopelagius inordinatus]SFH01395.1 hypothetical protein SAMN04488063_3593 [Halopelagius inordinatus]